MNQADLQMELRGRYVILSQQFDCELRGRTGDVVSEIKRQKALLDNETVDFLRFVDLAALEQLTYELKEISR